MPTGSGRGEERGAEKVSSQHSQEGLALFTEKEQVSEFLKD
jgi:hypothetical protein